MKHYVEFKDMVVIEWTGARTVADICKSFGYEAEDIVKLIEFEI